MKKLTLLCAALILIASTSFSQNALWLKGSESTGFKDQAFATDIDLSGNTYVAGNYADTLHLDGQKYSNYINDLTNDGFVAKYNPDGSLAWIKTVNGPGDQLLKSLKVDKNTGDCYVSGSFKKDFYIDGIKQNTQTFSGFSVNTSRSFIMRFDTNGNLVWSNNTFSLSGYEIDGGHSIALSPDGASVYMVNGYIGDVLFESGEAFLPGGFGVQGIHLSKINTATGTISAFRNDVEQYLVDGYILDTDNAGNLIFAGSHSRTCMNEVDTIAFSICDTNPNYAHPEAFIWKMDANFVSMWGKEINGIGDEVITAVGTDAQNNIYAYGTFSSLTSFDNTDILPDSGKLNAFVVKYNPSGNYQFIKQFSSEFLYITEFPTDYESPFVVDAKGNIYLGGGFAGSLIYETDTLVSNSSPHLFYANGFLIKLNKNGSFRWGETFEGNVGPHDETYVRGLGVLGSYISVCGEFGWFNAYNGDTVFADGNAMYVAALQDCDVTINVSASALLVSAAFPVTLSTPAKPGYSYQWQRNNVNIPGAVSNTYVTTVPGNYKCIITTGLCVIESKRVRLFLHPREGGADNAAITVYPNPAKEQLNIQLPASQFNKSFNLIITDLSGRIIYSENSNSGESGLINIHLQNSISSGTYIIQLVGDNYTSTTSVVIE